MTSGHPRGHPEGILGVALGKSAYSLPCVHSLPAFTPGGCGLQSELKTLGRWWHLGDEERAVL